MESGGFLVLPCLNPELKHHGVVAETLSENQLFVEKELKP